MSVKQLEDGKAEHRRPYEWKNASVTVAGADPTTDITGIAGFTTLFDDVTRAHRVKISSAATAYFRLNADDNDIITVTGTTPYQNDYCIVDKIYVATGGASVSITIKLE